MSFYLLSGNYPVVKDKANLIKVLQLLRDSNINFRAELRQFLPHSQAMQLRDFSKLLESKILGFLGNKH